MMKKNNEKSDSKSSTNFSSRFMPNVKFSIMGNKRNMLKDIGIPLLSNYVRTAFDGSIADICDYKTTFENWVGFEEVSIYEAMPELVPVGMFYDKKCDSLVKKDKSTLANVLAELQEAFKDFTVWDTLELGKKMDAEDASFACPFPKSVRFEIPQDIDFKDLKPSLEGKLFGATNKFGSNFWAMGADEFYDLPCDTVSIYAVFPRLVPDDMRYNKELDKLVPDVLCEPNAKFIKQTEKHSFKESVEIICDDIKNMLIEKNKAYGNSALEPVRIFSKADTTEQINVRIDDKLSRLKKGNEYHGDDTINDLIGYLILLKITKDKKC